MPADWRAALVEAQPPGLVAVHRPEGRLTPARAAVRERPLDLATWAAIHRQIAVTGTVAVALLWACHRTCSG